MTIEAYYIVYDVLIYKILNKVPSLTHFQAQCFECDPELAHVGDMGVLEFGKILNTFISTIDLPFDKLDGSRGSQANHHYFS